MQNTLQKFHSIFLYGFFFTLPWQTIWIIREVFFAGEKWQYGTIGIYMSDAFLFAWMCSSIILYSKKVTTFISKNPHVIIATILISCWGFISILWADDRILAVYFAIKLSCALDIFILLQIIPTSFTKISIAIIANGLLQSLIGLHQFTTQSTFDNSFLGTQYHAISWGGTATITVDHERWLRLYGAMPHPNIFGGLLIVTILLSFYLYSNNTKKLFYQKLFLLFCIGLFTINIIMTFSRTAWITLSLCLIIFITYNYLREKVFLYKNIAPFMVLFFSIFLMAVIFAPLFFTRITHDTAFTHNSFDDRKMYITHAIILIKKYPLIGAGIGNYTNSIYRIDYMNPIWYYQPVHNTYLLLCAELGMVGIILFVYFFSIICKTIYTRIQLLTTRDITILLIIFSITFIALFDHWLWTSHFGLFTLFIFLGLLLKKAVPTNVTTA